MTLLPLPYKPIVMVNFVGQLDWAKGRPGSWLHVISGCVCEGVSTRGHEPHFPPIIEEGIFTFIVYFIIT